MVKLNIENNRQQLISVMGNFLSLYMSASEEEYDDNDNHMWTDKEREELAVIAKLIVSFAGPNKSESQKG